MCRLSSVACAKLTLRETRKYKNDQEHISNLNEVLTRLKNAGLRLKLSKCQFMQPSVEYLGYRVDASGLHAIEKKVQAIRDAPAPENQQQLRSFLGMVNY